MKTDHYEGHATHDQALGTLTIQSFGVEVWSTSVIQPPEKSHRSLVGMMARAGFQVGRFRKRFAQAFWGDEYTPECLDHEGYMQEFSGVIPDAWLAFPRHQVLAVVEVDVTHTPPAGKYTRIWRWLDCESWSLCVIHVNRFGGISTPHHDFPGIYLSGIGKWAETRAG